jgi:TonB family protein
MAFPTWLDNLIAYSLQIAILASAGILLAHVFRVRVPRISLAYWQVLLMACLLLPALQNWKHPALVPAHAVSEPIGAGIAETPLSNPSSPESLSWTSADIITVVLATGMGLRLLWLALALFRLQLLLRHSQFVSSRTSDATGIAFQIGVRAKFFVSDEIDSPATFGIADAKVILPRSFFEMSEACREAILRHELLHVRRRDWAMILAEEILRCIFWFHPAVWWLLARIHLSREQQIDYEVVSLTGKRQPYLDSLLEIAKSRGRPKAVPAPLFLGERHLVQRISLLVKEASMNRWRLAFSLVGIALLLTGTVHIASAWFPLTGDPVISQALPVNPTSTVPAREPFVASGPLEIKSADEIAPVTPNPVSLIPADPSEPAAPKASHSAPGQENTGSVPSQRQPLRVGSYAQETKLIAKVDPVYPELAKQARVEQTVTIEITVDEAGNVANAIVLQGHPLLNQAAINAVKQWKYSPTLLNGTPVPVITSVFIMFHINNQSFLAEPAPVARPVRLPAAQYSSTLNQDSSYGSIAISIFPAGQLASSDNGQFIPPELSLYIHRLHALMDAAGWASVTPGSPATYTFSMSESGAISDIRQSAGISIPGMEEELARSVVLSAPRIGANPISVQCILGFRSPSSK